ncbi:hypothetical protein FB566_2911 [Stackebrandtia endophytica]|uniref:Uncharacterized protein n=1 Tax=Stackebrandtia endophytica TaxID=1496996 RepID=A0A543AXP6_9ACTN|nr:hypothetical protein [Stackebrandtia endophytica]TQL77352.1 hypothetical protein FB566_2911 [Stackebrandtia endophytica]
MAITVAAIAAVASIVSAVVAGWFAHSSRRHELRSRRAEAAHERLVEQKREMYEPIVDLLGKMFTSDVLPTPQQQLHKQRFDTWVNLYGSDGVIEAYSRFLIAMPTGPPAEIQFRLYADFLLEVRKDMGHVDTTASRIQILGPQLLNFPDKSSLTDPDLAAVCRRAGWNPPW